jgi:hypothetical protein
VVYPTRESKTWTVKPNPAHRWFYKQAQRPDEVVMIKCFDSDVDVARRVPHAAFEDPAAAEESDRESIEVRCLLVYDSDLSRTAGS